MSEVSLKFPAEITRDCTDFKKFFLLLATLAQRNFVKLCMLNLWLPQKTFTSFLLIKNNIGPSKSH